MNEELQSARDDLAFLRALIQAGGDNQRAFGEAYFAAGLIYGGQMLLHGGQALGLLPSTPIPGLLIGLGPTVVFAVAMTWIGWRQRAATRPNALVARAMGAVFGAIGLANLALVVVIGSVAWREHSLTIWLIYPCAVFVLQGAAWLATYMLRRRGWLGLVAAGWFATAIAMAFFITVPAGFIVAAGIGIWLCMALPGWVMLRLSRETA